MGQIVHVSAKGKIVDMNKLAQQNELTLAVGNVRVNARGDEIGPGGKIINKKVDHVPNSNMANQFQSVEKPAIVEPAVNNVIQPPVQAKSPKQAIKDVSNMDPEGNE